MRALPKEGGAREYGCSMLCGAICPTTLTLFVNFCEDGPMKTWRVAFLACVPLATLLAAGCAGQLPPEERTDDGLVRVPSRAAGGVYRNLDVTFTQYKRVMIEPLTVEFWRDWRKQHPEVEDAEVRRIQTEAARMFREEFIEVLVDEGPYELAETREPDVFVVVPRVLEMDIPAPNAGVEPGIRSYAPHPVKMQLNGEVRDAMTGAVLLRVISFEGQQRYGFNELRLANRATNAHEMRQGFNKWSRLVREAFDVAKTAKPR